MRIEEKPDPLFPDAVRLTVEAQKGSTSVLQRGLGIGYGKAVQLIDLIEELKTDEGRTVLKIHRELEALYPIRGMREREHYWTQPEVVAETESLASQFAALDGGSR